MTAKVPEGMTPIHHMTFAYLTFAEHTDNVLSPKEKVLIFSKLRQWTTEYDFERIYTETLTWYDSCYPIDRVDHLMKLPEILRQNKEVTDEYCISVLEDFVAIAKVDGKYHDDEREWIRILANRFGVKFDQDAGTH